MHEGKIIQKLHNIAFLNGNYTQKEYLREMMRVRGMERDMA